MTLRAWRRAKGWTQGRLAEALDTAKITISRYERGERVPEGDMMSRIYRLTDGAVTPNDFYDLPDLDLRGRAARRGEACHAAA